MRAPLVEAEGHTGCCERATKTHQARRVSGLGDPVAGTCTSRPSSQGLFCIVDRDGDRDRRYSSWHPPSARVVPRDGVGRHRRTSSAQRAPPQRPVRPTPRSLSKIPMELGRRHLPLPAFLLVVARLRLSTLGAPALPGSVQQPARETPMIVKLCAWSAHLGSEFPSNPPSGHVSVLGQPSAHLAREAKK